MIRRLVIASLFTLPLPAQQEPVDHLRFTNGDQLQGHFGGISGNGKISWERPDIATPIELQQEKIRQIVLHGASPASPMANPCHVTLINGDRIPGKVVAADEQEYTIKSSAAGVLTLPRDVIATVAPNPFGGRLLYAGPFEEKGWNIARVEDSVDSQDPFAANGPLLADPTGKKEADARKGADDKASWSHAGTAWYSRSGGDAITYDANMPDRALLRFKLGWRSRPSFAVAFHADLAKPPAVKKADEDGDGNRGNFGGPSQFAKLFGNAYVLNFNPGYIRLQRTWFDEDGQPKVTGVRVGSTSIRLPDTGEALFEIRADRKEGCIAVYIDGEFALQWYTSEEDREGGLDESSYKAPGGAFGFQVQGGTSRVRISDIVVAEWNGMTDSARSMESEAQDIVLLTNGTDRFSGTVRGIQDGIVEIDSKYAGMKIPVNEVAEIRFAKSGRRKIEEAPAAEISVHLQPVGRISGRPVLASDGRIELEHRLAGKIDLDLAPAVVLEFQSAGGFLDDWDDDL